MWLCVLICRGTRSVAVVIVLGSEHTQDTCPFHRPGFVAGWPLHYTLTLGFRPLYRTKQVLGKREGGGSMQRQARG
jgi:hypothetical protein